MKSRVYLAASVILSVAVGTAVAQYTPGTGAPYVPAPSMPVAPAAVAPVPAGTPAYSWQSPAPTAAAAAPAPVLVATPVPAPADAQLQPVSPEAVQIVQPPAVAVPQLSDTQLNDLTSSVSLYPDPLLAEMLPAATYVQEITYADRWLSQHPGADDATIATLPVHPSVASLMHYPTVLSMMSDHLDWTQALGVAFQYQPNDVMEAVQRWRRTAVLYGTLASGPQLLVEQAGNTIMILPPPQAQLIYVPVYDPAVVFVRPLRPIRNAITFGAGGFSISFVQNDVDWHTHVIHVPEHHVDVVGHGPGLVVDPSKKTVFVHDEVKPVVAYPTHIETPTPDHKVLTVHSDHADAHVDTHVDTHGEGRGAIVPPAPGRGDRGDRGDRGNPPGTPF